MGLDIYIRRYEDRADAKAREDAYEKESEAIYGELKGDDKRDERIARHAALRARLGLSEYGGAYTDLAAPSAKYPEHMCNLGYFRSSYNGGGFDRVIPNLLGDEFAGFYYLFDRADADEYEFQPAWAAVRERAVKMLAAYDARIAADGGGLLRCFHVGNRFATDLPRTEAEAIAILRDEFAAYAKRPAADKTGGFDFSSYSNAKGEFYLKGITILAAIPGIGILKEPGTFLVYRQTVEEDWYRQAIEIVIEAADNILAMAPEEQAKVWVAWSS